MPWFTTSVLLGSAVGVYPAGRLSDRFDRRFVLIAAASLGALFEVALWRHQGGGFSLVALGFAVGVTSFSLYTIAISHANDRASAEQLLLVSSGMLFLYCIGAILAPTIAASTMRLFGPSTLFAQNAVVHLGLAAFAFWRIMVRQAPHPTLLRPPKEPQRPEPRMP